MYSFENHISAILEANEKYVEDINKIKDDAETVNDDIEKMKKISKATRDYAQDLYMIQWVAIMSKCTEKK